MTGELGDKENSIDAKMGWQQPGRGSTGRRNCRAGAASQARRPAGAVHEMFAVHTREELQAVIERIEAEGLASR
jgi:hypothetical protein